MAGDLGLGLYDDDKIQVKRIDFVHFVQPPVRFPCRVISYIRHAFFANPRLLK